MTRSSPVWVGLNGLRKQEAASKSNSVLNCAIVMNKWEKTKSKLFNEIVFRFSVCVQVSPLTEASSDFPPQVTYINRQQNGSDNPTAHRTLEGKSALLF